MLVTPSNNTPGNRAIDLRRRKAFKGLSAWRLWGILALALATLACNVVEQTRRTVVDLLNPPTVTATATKIVITVTPTALLTPTPVAFLILPVVANPAGAQPLLPTPVPTITAPPTNTPTQTDTPTPTLTPSMTSTATETPVCLVLRFFCTPVPTVTQTPVIRILIPTMTPLPSSTPTVTMTPAPLPTPYLILTGEPVDLYTGPGENYPRVARLGQGIPLPVNGRDTEGAWWRVVVDYDEAWVEASAQLIISPTESIPLYVTPILYDLSPTAEPTFTPTATPPPFERAAGPEPFPSTNDRVTIWVKIYIGLPGNEQVLPGYNVHVEFQADNALTFTPWPNESGSQTSLDQFSVGSAGVFYNYKYEITPVQKGKWQLWLTDSSGLPLSPVSTFATDPANSQREFYIAWIRLR
jgi:hypothetical protein